MDIAKKTRKILTRRFTRVKRLDEAGLGTRIFLEAARRLSPQFQILPVTQHSDKSTVIAEVAPDSSFEVTPPSVHGGTVPTTRGRVAPLAIRRFENLLACGQASALLVDETISMPNHHAAGAGRVVADGQFLIWHGEDNKGILCTGACTEKHRRGISLFGTGTFNWYHWLIEQLPAAYLSEQLGAEFREVPFVVPEIALEIPSFKDSLALFAGDRRIEAISSPCHFDELFVVDSAVQEPFNMSEGHWPATSDYRFHPGVIRGFREAIIDRLGIKKQPHHRRIFLARAHGRRSYNQDEAVAIAVKMGFEPVYPETMTFREQVQMMHDAAIVIGPSGASFANTLFCQPDTQLLSWLIPEYRGFCSYTNLATIAGCHISYLFTPTDRPIGSTREAFSVTYELELEEFKSALEKTVSKHSEARRTKR